MPALRLTACMLLVAALDRARAEGGLDIVSVYSSVSPAYVRTALPGGGFKTETFAFGEGGHLGGNMADLTIDKLRLADVARLIAPSLAGRSYVAASDPRQTDLLVMVYWGATDTTNALSERNIAQGEIPPPPPPLLPQQPNSAGDNGSGDPSMSANGFRSESINAGRAAADDAVNGAMAVENFANLKREKLDEESASILGYSTELSSMGPSSPSALNLRRQEIVDELEESRYYVVLMAYDFQTLLLHKQRKLLWETRFSIRARGHDFAKDVASMAQNASRYFGQGSHGLIRDRYRADVSIGTMRIVGMQGGREAKGGTP